MPFPSFMKTKVVCVWHHDSPGLRVYVKRGWLRRFVYRLLYDEEFSRAGEKFLCPKNDPEIQAQSLEMAKIFHYLYEKHAVEYGYTTRPTTRIFSPFTPNAQLMMRVCQEILTGGYRLNPTTMTTNTSAAQIVAELKLLAVEVGISATDPNQTAERLELTVVDEPDSRSFTLNSNNGEEIYVSVEDSEYQLNPPELNRIARELAEYLNAQLFALKQPIRIVSVEYTWEEENGVKNITRLLISVSVWENTLTDPRATQTSLIIRPELLEPKEE